MRSIFACLLLIHCNSSFSVTGLHTIFHLGQGQPILTQKNSKSKELDWPSKKQIQDTLQNIYKRAQDPDFTWKEKLDMGDIGLGFSMNQSVDVALRLSTFATGSEKTYIYNVDSLFKIKLMCLSGIIIRFQGGASLPLYNENVPFSQSNQLSLIQKTYTEARTQVLKYSWSELWKKSQSFVGLSIQYPLSYNKILDLSCEYFFEKPENMKKESFLRNHVSKSDRTRSFNTKVVGHLILKVGLNWYP